ncbi:hypothetical protein HY486_00950 [Candidatus Woesearchaeota archaeon]|nr:hypothetical protein [Candidatus Woesearchaeota archaeon]
MGRVCSLWLCADGLAHEWLENLVKSLSQKYCTPSFIPHLTLLGDIPLREDTIAIAHAFARTQKRMLIFPLFIAYTSEPFKALYLHCEASDDLDAAHISARALFGMSAPAKYSPHISLLYDIDKEDRDQSRVSNDAKIEEIVIIGKKFPFRVMCSRLVLYDTTKFSEWSQLAGFTL